MNKMGKPPKFVYTGGETVIRNSGLFQKYFKDDHLAYVATQSRLVVSQRMICTFKDMLYTIIKPNMQWAHPIYPILLTYNNKLLHSPTGLTPKEARDPPNELEAYVNMKLKAKATQNPLS